MPVSFTRMPASTRPAGASLERGFTKTWFPSCVVFHAPMPLPITQPNWLRAVCVVTVYSTVKLLSVPVTRPCGSEA